MSRLDENYRSIGEVADSLGLPQHVLRFWETRFSEIRPLKRAGGRRLYRDSDVELVAAIKRMLYDDGYTIKGVQRILKEKGIAGVLEAERGPPPPDFDAEPADGLEAPGGAQEPEADAAGDPPPPAVAPPVPEADWSPRPARFGPAPESVSAPLPPVAAPASLPSAPEPAKRPASAPTPDRARLAAALAEIDECIRLLTVTRRN